MRKNKMLRMASALLILVLLTTSVVGGTFAKYTTSTEATDTARVAKWGVTFGAHSDLFATSYNGTDSNSANVTVKSSNSDKLVAPGTTGTGFSIKISGTPEVSYEVKVKLDNGNAKVPTLKYTPSSGSEATYEPVKFSVYNGDTKIKDNLNLSDLTTAFDGTKVIYKYDVNDGKYYVATDLNGTLSTTGVNDVPDIKIKWEWAFETGADDSAKALNDKLDTFLGNRAAEAGSTFPTDVGTLTTDSVSTEVNLSWTMTATQID